MNINLSFLKRHLNVTIKEILLSLIIFEVGTRYPYQRIQKSVTFIYFLFLSIFSSSPVGKPKVS